MNPWMEDFPEPRSCRFTVREMGEWRPCGKWATREVGAIDVCHVHHRILEEAIRAEVAEEVQKALELRRLHEESQAAVGRPLRTSKRKNVVYFVQAASGGPIKIGTAANIKARLGGLQTGAAEPLRVLATMPGAEEVERALHERFALHRIRGEWFSPAPELLGFIAEIEAPAA